MNGERNEILLRTFPTLRIWYLYIYTFMQQMESDRGLRDNIPVFLLPLCHNINLYKKKP